MSDILFPIVGCNGAHIATVRCDCLNAKDYPAGRALVLARDEREIERILADARSNEPTGAEIATPIWVRFMPQQFTGKSYGLALALADKRARYRPASQDKNVRLFATGLIIEDGFGRIGKVSSFEKKLRAIADAAEPGDIVILAKGNVDDASPGERAFLDQLSEKGANCRVADRLDELADLYGMACQGQQAVSSGEGGKPKPMASFAAMSPREAGPVGESKTVRQAEKRTTGTLRKLAASVALIIVTSLLAFAAGDRFGGGSLVLSYAGETPPQDETTAENLLENPSFEQGAGQQPVGWVTYSRGKHDHADYVRAGGIDGSLVLEHSSDKAFYVDTHQILSVPEGYYAFSAWISSEGRRKAHRMRARGDDEPLEIDVPMTAPHSFQRLSIHCIKVTEGRLAVGFYMDAFKESSAAYDKVEVVENHRTADGRDCVDQPSKDNVSANALEGENLVENPSFERSHDQNPIGWGTFSRGKFDDADSVQPGGLDGSFALEHGGKGRFYVDTYQVLRVENGHYAMSAWVDADGVDKVNRMYARGDNVIELDIPKKTDGGYQEFRIHCIKASEQKVVVGFYTDTHQTSNVAYDNVRLIRHDQAADGSPCAKN